MRQLACAARARLARGGRGGALRGDLRRAAWGARARRHGRAARRRPRLPAGQGGPPRGRERHAWPPLQCMQRSLMPGALCALRHGCNIAPRWVPGSTECAAGASYGRAGAPGTAPADPHTCRVPCMAAPSAAAPPRRGASAAAALRPHGAAPPRIPGPLRAPPPAWHRAARPPVPAPAASRPRSAAPAPLPHPARAAALSGRSPHPARWSLPAAGLLGMRRTRGRHNVYCPRGAHPAAGPLSEGGHALQPARPPPPGHAQDGRARMASARGRPRDARRPSWSCAAEREHSLSSSRNTTGALRPGGASKACRGRSHRAGLGGIGKRSCGAEHTSSRLTLGSARAFATSRRSCYQCRMGARSCLLAEKPSAIRRQGARLQARMQDVRLPAAGPAFQALQRGLRRQARSGRPCAACSACSLGCTCGVRLRAPHSACCARGGAVHARPLAPVAACVMPDRCTWRDHTCPLTITRQPVQRGGCSSAARPARGACCGCRTAHSVQPAQAHACAHWLSGQHAALHRGPFPRERPAPGRLMAQPPQAPRRAARG